MITLIKQATLHAPAFSGQKDILVSDQRIAAIADSIDIPNDLPALSVVDAKGLMAVPGFIDNHVHIAGGGGEGGFETRTPEIEASDLIKAGVTTVIGVRGTDGFTRTMKNFITKAKSLRKKGLSCWILTGSYQVPVRTLTESIELDIMLVDEIIGVGEIAIADHRSSHPDVKDLTALVSSARIGGMLAGKAGVVNIHLGSGENGFDMIEACLAQSEFPQSHLLPTHVNRNFELLSRGFEYAKRGGFIDLTTSGYTEGKDDIRTKCSRALKMAIEDQVPVERISFSSDGQGSLPVFDENFNFQGYGVGSCASLLAEVRDAVVKEKIPLETAIRVITRNPAEMLQLHGKGKIEKGYDADIVLLKEDLSIAAVMAKGRFHKAGYTIR